MKTAALFPAKDFTQSYGPCALCGHVLRWDGGEKEREGHLQYHAQRGELERLPSGDWRLVFGHPPVAA